MLISPIGNKHIFFAIFAWSSHDFDVPLQRLRQINIINKMTMKKIIFGIALLLTSSLAMVAQENKKASVSPSLHAARMRKVIIPSITATTLNSSRRQKHGLRQVPGRMVLPKPALTTVSISWISIFSIRRILNSGRHSSTTLLKPICSVFLAASTRFPVHHSPSA